MSTVLDYINGTGEFKRTSTRRTYLNSQAEEFIEISKEKGSRDSNYNRRYNGSNQYSVSKFLMDCEQRNKDSVYNL